MIISVGYRVKSKRGVEFRRWANNVLKQYVLRGYAVNQKRLNDLGSVVKLLKRTENSLDAKQVLTVVERYSTALDLLDSYDHQTLQRPKGNSATYRLTYEECRQVIDSMRFGEASDLFGLEKVNEVGIDQFLLLLPAEHRKNRRGEDHQDQNIKADLSLSVAFRFQAWVTSYLSTLACLCGVL